MAHHVEQTMRIKLPAAKVWEVLADFGSIERFQEKVLSSPILAGTQSGVGTKRKCNFYDNSSVIEEIVEYQEGQGFKIELSEYAMPLKSLMAEMKVVSVDADTCDIFMSMDYVVKGGPVGWLAGKVMMQPMMNAVLKKTLTGLAYHSATGNIIANKLPTQQEFNIALNN